MVPREYGRECLCETMKEPVAYINGKDAYRQGYSYADNPYTFDQWTNHEDWIEGYERARKDEKIRQELNRL